jgi:parvulin-like peptidyl-prolyl isomerase
LEKLRGELQGKDLAAFAEAAKQYSQGPGAADGGALGWVEPGTYQSAFDEVVFSIKPGQLSEVFIADRLAYLVLVTDCNEASHRAFGEVVGEIENALLRNQEQAARDEAVRMLRAKALVRDITTIQQVIN